MNRTRVLCTLAVLASLAVLPTAAHAAVDMYLEANGIPGDVTATGYENQIGVLAFSFGVSRAKGAYRPSFQDVSFTKYVDQSSPTLLQDVASGKLVSPVKLHVVKAGATPLEFLRYCFTGVHFTSLSGGGSGGEDRLTENVSFNYQTIVERFTEQNSDGSAGDSFYGGWDLVANLQFGGPANC